MRPLRLTGPWREQPETMDEGSGEPHIRSLPNARKMRKPVEISDFFLCVGAQKSGTTWLARMLERHPEIFVTPVKEIHYFDHAAGISAHLSDRKRRSRYRKYHQRLLTQWHRWAELGAQRRWYQTYMRSPLNDAWYASLFAERGGRRIAGEATPEYAIIGREGFEHIARLAPGARLIYIMRNPVTRAWSQILHVCRSQGHDADRMTAQELIGLTRDARFAALADYAVALDAMLAVFPRERVWLGFYEDIHADRTNGLSEICSFLGVGFDAGIFADTTRRYNVSQSVGMPQEVRAALREQYAGQLPAVEARLGRLPDSWRAEFGSSVAEPGPAG